MVIWTIEQHFTDKARSNCTATENDLDIAINNIKYMVKWLSKHPHLDHITVFMSVDEDKQ